jgi:hypothetical protein
MKKMIIAVSAAATLGMGTALAQGLPAGTAPPVYGSQAFPHQPYHDGTVFSKILDHLRGDQTVERTAERHATHVKGG